MNDEELNFLMKSITAIKNSEKEKHQEKWDRRFLRLAEEIATWSKDPSTQVGAVLVDGTTNEIISLGYNGFPRGVDDNADRYNDRELKYSLVVHAEENAIISAGHRARNATLYVVPSFMLPPICSRCCASAIQAHIKEVVGYVVNENELDDRQLRWKDSILLSRMMCDEAGVSYRGIRK